jgi:formylglycine-generating enzyme required for sulfatase activity
VELFRQINSGNLPEIIGNIPVGWQNLIRRCLVVDPQRRAKDVTELRDVLGGEKRPVSDMPPPPPPPPTDDPTRIDNQPSGRRTNPPPLPPPPPVAPANWFSRYRLIAALACVIVVGIGIFFLYTANNPTPDAPSGEETPAASVPPEETPAEPVRPPAASVADAAPETPEPAKPAVTREETRTPEVQTIEREVIRMPVSRTEPVTPPPPVAPPVVVVPPPSTANATTANATTEMVYVRGGTFTMGCTAEQGTDCYDDEKPAHEVTVSDFYIGKYEVTQAEWKAVMGSNPSNFKGDNLPVEKVSWNDAQEFIRKLNTTTGKNYRLPTEAEWEYAARGGSQSRGFKYSGSNNIDDVAWYEENSGDKTHPVGTKPANELGIYDMTGNVWEWVNDRYGGYSSGSQTNPVGPSSGSYRVLRGGSWDFGARSARVSFCNRREPGHRSGSLGFRLASSSR